MKKKLFTLNKSDFRFDYYIGTGKGGQKRNKTSNCVRCTHEKSSAVGKSELGRSQSQNKQLAFKKMAESNKFKQWVRIEAAKKSGLKDEIDKIVTGMMMPYNIKTEVKNNGKWVMA